MFCSISILMRQSSNPKRDQFIRNIYESLIFLYKVIPRRHTQAIILVIEMSFKLQKGAIIDVVYFSIEKLLLYWSGDQYNNVPKG